MNYGFVIYADMKIHIIKKEMKDTDVIDCVFCQNGKMKRYSDEK